MSATPKTSTKRKLDTDTDIEETGSKRVSRATQQQREEEAAFQLTVKMHKKYTKYPLELRTNLEKSCKTAFHIYMATLRAGISPTHRQTFNIVTGMRSRSETLIFTTKIAQSNILELNIANTALLELFATQRPKKLDAAHFVKLNTVKGFANCKFIHLHAVRVGELGWGFDAEGCVSIFATYVVDLELRDAVWYVEKGVVKIEDEN